MGLHIGILFGYQFEDHVQYLRILSIGGKYIPVVTGCIMWIIKDLIGGKISLYILPQSY
jgi:hypothetical protein